jgi:hypothetical protein
VRLTAINLALRNLYGYAVWGNSLANEKRLIYRTGFDLHGVISEVALQECPPQVQGFTKQAADDVQSLPESPTSPTEDAALLPPPPRRQLKLF